MRGNRRVRSEPFGWALAIWLISAAVVQAASASTPVVGSTGSVVPSTTAAVVSALAPTPTTAWRTSPNRAFYAGEELVFAIKWGVITGGHSNLFVKSIDTIGERQAFHIVSEARSNGFVDRFYKTRDENHTWLDVQSLATLRYTKNIHEGRYRLRESVELDQVHHVYRDDSNRLDRGTTSYLEGPIPAYTMDVLGSLYFVRTLPLEVGQSFKIDVYDGKKVWPLIVKVQKREKVKVPAGKFDCFRVEPLLREPGVFMRKGKKLQVWLTADEARIPVLMRSEIMIGHVSAELISYNRPPRPAPPAP